MIQNCSYFLFMFPIQGAVQKISNKISGQQKTIGWPETFMNSWNGVEKMNFV